MGICFDCGKTNKDESLNQIRHEAKQKAIADGQAMAIFKEANQYNIITASAAIAGNYPIIEIISQYS